MDIEIQVQTKDRGQDHIRGCADRVRRGWVGHSEGVEGWEDCGEALY